MSDQYADFAGDYDWLFTDFRAVGDRHVQEAAPWLAMVVAPRILDCACGTGLLTLALARHGHRVVGTDASPEMIARARDTAEREGLSCELSTCAWRDLPDRFDSRFDVVFCGGNSIGHCRDDAEMIEALTAMAAVLEPGGRLVLHTRDWEFLLVRRDRFTPMGVRERDGARCHPLYVWAFPEEPTAPVTVDVVFLFEIDDGITLRNYSITYYPFTVRQLMRRLEVAGFVDVEKDPQGPGAYYVVARKPSRVSERGAPSGDGCRR